MTPTFISIDDFAMQGAILQKMLKKLHYSFSFLGHCTNGPEGIQLAAERQPDLVFVDVEMPEMDGFSVIDRIRPLSPGSRFIILSAHDDFNYMQKAVQLHIHDYLTKPISSRELRRSIDLFLAAPAPVPVSSTISPEPEPSLSGTSEPENGKSLEEINDSELGSYVLAARNWTDQHLGEDITLQQLADQLYISASHLSRLFREQTGITYSEYLLQKRLKLACSLLSTTDDPIELIAMKCGYDKSNSFWKMFKKRMGIAPGQYRSGK